MDHAIIKTDSGYQCTVCQWTWKSRPERDGCPGVVRYRSGCAPVNLRTQGQLEKKRLHPGGPCLGVVKNTYGTYELFDLAAAVPFSEEEIATAKERARVARLRKCKACGKLVDRRKWDDHWKACDSCRPAVIKEHYRQEAIREELIAQQEKESWEAARAESVQQARAWLALGDQAVILDTETTGLERAEIVEVSVIGMNGQELLNLRVRPACEITPGAYAVHRINLEMLADAPTFPEIYPRLAELLTGRVVITYNAAFDSKIVDHCCRVHQLDLIPAQAWECAMETYAAYYGEWSNYWGSYKWQPLAGGDHSALGDCRATLALIQRMAADELSNEE